MTTLCSTTTPASSAVQVERGRVTLIALWMVQMAMAGIFFLAGGLKLTGAPDVVATFDTIGFGQWFRYATGAIEVVSTIALLVPSLAPFGALVLVPTMVAAIATHLFVIGGSATPATVLLMGSLAIAWVRRRQLTRVLAKRY